MSLTPLIKSYTKKELKELYGCSYETLFKWLEPVIPLFENYKKTDRIFTPAQVKIIFEHLGTPENE